MWCFIQWDCWCDVCNIMCNSQMVLKSQYIQWSFSTTWHHQPPYVMTFYYEVIDPLQHHQWSYIRIIKPRFLRFVNIFLNIVLSGRSSLCIFDISGKFTFITGIHKAYRTLSQIYKLQHIIYIFKNSGTMVSFLQCR